MTVVEKNCDNCDRDRNGDKVHPTVYIAKVGVEYLHGWRENFNDVNREANRINLSAQYNF